MKKFIVIAAMMMALFAEIMTPEVAYAAPAKIQTLQSTVTVYNSKLEQVELQNIDCINGEILETDESYLKFKHNGSIYYIHVNDTLYNKTLHNNTEYLQGEEVVRKSMDAFNTQVAQGSILNYTSPLHFGRRGVAGDLTNSIINDFQTSGSLDNQLKDVIKTVAGMDIRYGGDNSVQGQVSGLDLGYTMCNGVTWVTSRLLDKTGLEYRYVILYPVVSATNETITGAGHMYLEVKNANGSWMIFGTVEMLRYNDTNRDESKKIAIQKRFSEV